VGSHHVMLDNDLFVLSKPLPDEGPAQVQHLPFAFLLKDPFGKITPRPFLPESGDVLPQLLGLLLNHNPFAKAPFTLRYLRVNGS
jgi:hypothetical protein